MPQRRSDLVSVIVLDRGDRASTEATIAAIAATDWPDEYREIIVVSSSASAWEEKDVVAVRHADTAVHPANTGAARARGQYLGIVEAGIRPQRDWISAALQTFHGGLQIGAVASKTVRPDSDISDYSGGGMTWAGMGFNAAPEGDEDRPRDVLFATRAAMFVRSNALKDVGGFDALLSDAYDDVDLGWRLNLFGHRVRFAPRSVAEGPSADSLPTPRETLERNALVVLFKNLEDQNLGKFLAGALGLAIRQSALASSVVTKDQDDTSTPDVAAFEVALSSLRGADSFIDSIDALTPVRAEIQRRRLLRDDALFSLFGDSSRSLDADPSMRHTRDALARALQIVVAQGRIRVLVVTSDLVGTKMAGPAIRVWNMCEQLAYRNDVRLVTPAPPGRASTRFEVTHAIDDRAMQEHEDWADVIVIQGYVLAQYRSLALTEKILVADIYDPLHLEQLEQARQPRFDDWNAHVINAADVLNSQIARADYLLCASDKQRDFWLGQLAAVGRVNAMTYEADNALRGLIDVAPFGLDPILPPQERHAIKGAVPGISTDDKVLVWGGGIYDWFDTETLLHAVAKVSESHPNVRLFFLGVAHPNPGVPMMKAQARTFEISDSLGLTDRIVFFNRDWVAFDDRHNYLLDADAGVSTHYEHIETAFSFRTRILDYLWAELPMVTTRGDGFAELIENSPLGVTVPEKDVDALASAIIAVLYDEEFRTIAKHNIAEARQQFAWSRALAPLIDFCAAPRSAPDRGLSSHGRVLRMPDPIADSIRSRHRGFDKYVRLSALYLRREGVTGFVKRARFRLGI